MPPPNADPNEIAKFSELAHRWWDPESEFKPLHEINPLRLVWIDQRANVSGKKILDVGCGGGILAESLAKMGANVTGIDLSEKALSVARLHLLESGNTVTYQKTAVEDLAATHPESFDVVTCMEMLEHVPDPSSVVHACSRLAKPGGHVFLSTINRNLTAYLAAIIGAEYLLNMLPRGTHEYGKFIKPSELTNHLRAASLDAIEIAGIAYNPAIKKYSVTNDTKVNYMIHATKNKY